MIQYYPELYYSFFIHIVYLFGFYYPCLQPPVLLEGVIEIAILSALLRNLDAELYSPLDAEFGDLPVVADRHSLAGSPRVFS